MDVLQGFGILKKPFNSVRVKLVLLFPTNPDLTTKSAKFGEICLMPRHPGVRSFSIAGVEGVATAQEKVVEGVVL